MGLGIAEDEIYGAFDGAASVAMPAVIVPQCVLQPEESAAVEGRFIALYERRHRGVHWIGISCRRRVVRVLHGNM